MTSHKSSTPHASDNVDEARQALCKSLARGLSEGANSYQIRFHRTKDHPDTPTEVWIYAHTHDDWKKRDDLAIANHLVAALWGEFLTLASREYSDIWTLRRADHSDRTDFELKFRHEAIVDHVNGGLESYLLGCLFLGRHDSGKDDRRRGRLKGS